MLKKRMAAMFMTCVLGLGILSGCALTPESAQKQDGSSEESGGEDLKTLKVAVQPYYNGMQMAYIKDQKLDEKNGLNIELSVYSNGSTQNEALAANLWDVAMTGGAFVFGVANYDAKVIGNHIDGTGGNEIWVRPDSPIAEVKGYNPTYPDVLGSPDTVKGAKIIMSTGTTSQLCAVKWLEAIGVNEEDVEMVNMDYASGYQAFVAGEADAVVLVSPYCYDAPDQGWVKAADLINLDTPNYEVIVASNDAYENKKDEITTFMSLVYEANNVLENDFEKKVEYTMKWYGDNANEVTEESARAECELKPLITSEKAEALEMGVYEKEYAEFMVMIDKLESSKIDVVESNVKSEISEAALEQLDSINR